MLYLPTRFDASIACYYQQSIKLVRDKIAHFLHGIWCSRTGKRTKGVSLFNYAITHFLNFF